MRIWDRAPYSASAFLRVSSDDGLTFEVERRAQGGSYLYLVWLDRETPLSTDDTEDIRDLIQEVDGRIVGPSDLPHINARGHRALKFVSVGPRRREAAPSSRELSHG